MSYLADLHIHVGINEEGKWVKIPSSKNLTVKNILDTAKDYKGLDIVGIIDALSPYVQKDIKKLIAAGDLKELSGGGYSYHNGLTVILGGEVETKEEGGGLAHTLLFLPTIEQMEELSKVLSVHIKNINISSQNVHMNLQSLYNLVGQYNVKIIPAHIFTPFKSIYGNCSDRMSKLFSGKLPAISAVELGLSADSHMADRIGELSSFSYVASSDAHSLPNIAREFSELDIVGEVNFNNIFAAIEGRSGCIKTLYGLNPALGKYYTTRCVNCDAQMDINLKKCTVCGGRVVRGVKERINEISDYANDKASKRDLKYLYHIPLIEIPGIGKKTMEKFYFAKLTELSIIYNVSVKVLENLVGQQVTNSIIKIRKQEFLIKSGGAGQYGYVIIN